MTIVRDFSACHIPEQMSIWDIRLRYSVYTNMWRTGVAPNLKAFLRSGNDRVMRSSAFQWKPTPLEHGGAAVYYMDEREANTICVFCGVPVGQMTIALIHMMTKLS